MAYAPLFMRFVLIFERLEERSCVERYPRVRTWAEALLALAEVQRSVVPDFPELYAAFIIKQGGYLAQPFRSGG
jgi:hypothetical protein